MSKKTTFDKKIFVRINDNLKNEFKKSCEKNNTTPSKLLREFIEKYVDSN